MSRSQRVAVGLLCLAVVAGLTSLNLASKALTHPGMGYWAGCVGAALVMAVAGLAGMRLGDRG